MKKVHWYIQHLKADLQFTEHEIDFIEELFNSDIFKQNIPDMFERIQRYLQQLKNYKIRSLKLRQLIENNEKFLDTVLEADNDVINSDFDSKNTNIEREAIDFKINFQHLKSEIYNFIGGTLKKSTTHSK